MPLPLGVRRLARSFLDAAGGPRRVSPDYLGRQVARSWEKESRHLGWFGLRDGMAVLDLGCGPGHFTERLAESRPNVTITALDADPEMIQRARERLGNR